MRRGRDRYGDGEILRDVVAGVNDDDVTF